MADLWHDLRYAARSLRKHALLSAVVVATLSFGIGVSTGIFTFYNAEFLRPQVDKDYDSFAKVYAAYTRDPRRFGRPRGATLEDYLAWRDGAKSLGDLVAWAQFNAPFGQGDRARGALVSCNFFALYDPGRPLLGRLLQPADCAAAQPVMVLSERLWRVRFGADPQIIGKSVPVNGQGVTVVGVTPNYAGMVQGSRAWLPYTLETYLKLGDHLSQPGEENWLQVEGRLQSGFSRRQAAAELQLLAGLQERLHPGRHTRLFVTDGSAIQEPGGEGGRMVLVVAVIVGVLTIFVLLICVNVATLLLARAAARRQEIAVRLALGASRWRLARMLLAETFLLAGLAGLASIYLAYKLPGILDRWLTNPLGETGGTWQSLAPDWLAFGYLALVTLLAGAMAGLAPALQSLKVNLTDSLKGRPSRVQGVRLHGWLIGTQVALSFFLLFSAAFCVRIAQRVAAFEPGFETRQTLWANVRPRNRVTEPRSWEDFQRNLTERLSALPGVQAVAFARYRPFSAIDSIDVQARGEALRRVDNNWVSPNYFAVLGIPIVSGRALRADDPPCELSGCRVVVSERLAREFWPNGNPLGQTLRDARGNSFEVVGVARDVAGTSLGLGEPTSPLLYQPLTRKAFFPAAPFVRFSGDAATTLRAVTITIQELAPEFSVMAETFQAVMDHLREGLGRLTQLVVFLCAIAVGLAAIGIYGVVAFAVAQCTREIGIRLALGAQKPDIYRAVVGGNGRPIVVGLLIGLAFTVAAFTALAPLLRQAKVGAHVQEPLTYVGAAILLAAVALGAMLRPARRATKVDPLVALRCE
jgi:predicted permease